MNSCFFLAVLTVSILAQAAFGQQNAGKPTGDTFDNPTPKGDVRVKNFYKLPTTRIYGTQASIRENKDYGYGYIPEGKNFAITLTGKPLEASRRKAEADFLSTLGITRAQACNLTVSLAVPYNVDHDASGVQYGLSFCPGAVALP